MKVLALKSSIVGDNSFSSKLIDYFVENTNAEVKIRDLAADPVPVLDIAALGALNTPDSDIQKLSNEFIAELQDVDLVVVAAPMYNFNIPTQLKNYIDFIQRAGVTFRYSAEGPEGLIKNTRALCISTRGGFHAANGTDTVVPVVKNALGLIGIPADFVLVEGLNIDKATADAAMEKARKEILTYAK
ncbi:NADH-azoreductase FMN-dependent [Carpediemonas membranifera]|uniref:FMN-dependent NADH-azoreductase n=1 Tax=Carpediemonas membranifera TaxID=201153 RepID=A0A8J6E0K0_9EUKA|nr:NADH-azoreductase FMN-dependent [Carpediemonas membranifera]|eukprot:KAG9395229.1 NADH-azoreductase FMN-dependent [Carpediemonas membranifera]